MQRDRGQSSPMAAALLVGLVVAGAFTVVLFGGVLVEDITGSAESERAAQEMAHFASESAAVALGPSEQRRLTFDAAEGQLSVDPKGSWICLQNGSVTDREFILPESGGPDETCHDRKTFMGTVRYETGHGSVAYEGGGVWRKGETGDSRMVSPPEFHYRDETLTLPIVQVDGAAAVGGSNVDLTATAGSTERVEGIRNPLADDSGRVYVTVGSSYYQAWGEFIAQRTAGRVVELDHDNETVTVELVVPSPATINNAIYTSGTDRDAVYVQNMKVDSYDAATYNASTAKEGGDVTTDGGANPIKGTVEGDVHTVRQGNDVTIASDGRVNGSVHSQQDVDVLSSGVVRDDVRADGDVLVKGDEVGGSIHAGGDVTLGSSGVSVGDAVRTDGTLSFGSNGVTVSGDVHAAALSALGQTPSLNGNVYTADSYGEEGNPVGAPVAGELHARAGVYTDGTDVDGGTYTATDFVDTNSQYAGPVHVGADADLSGTAIDGDLHVGGDLETASSTDIDGTVHVAGDAALDSVTINGDLHVDGDIECSGTTTVNGDVYGTVEPACPLVSDGSPNVVGPTAPDAPKPPKNPAQPVADPPEIELPPESEFDSVPASCTNGGGTIQVQSGDHCRLPPGTYNVSKLDVDQGKLTFEQGGRVEVYVSSDLSLSSGNITTSPDGEHDATRVEVNYYGDQEASVLANVTGVINAPNVKVDMDAGNYQPHVFGAIIAEQVQGDNGVQVHYDEDLAGRQVGDGQGDTPTIRYLHVTTNEMTIED